MTAVDLRLEIAQQIENIPDSEQTLLRVLNYLRRLTKNDEGTITLTGDVLRLWNRTEELKNLPQSWDGQGAVPIEKKVVANMQSLLKQGLSTDFHNWVLFPDEAGTLLLQSREGNASISIGSNCYSYVFEKDGKIVFGDKVRFSLSSVLNVIRQINVLNGKECES